MSQTADDSDIDALYQLPLREFTPAREDLAKRSGGAAATIRKLQKPSAPAWAVNQLYWKRRKVFDRLLVAGESLRQTHARRLAGRASDVERAEMVHATALRAAVTAAEEVLTASGDPVSNATKIAITETLQALPWTEPPGRLTRPLRPLGFAALAGLLPKGGAAARQVAEVVAIDRSRRERAQAETAAERRQREHTERRREASAIERSLRTAKAESRKAHQSLLRVRQAVERAVDERDRLAGALEKANRALQGLREDATTEERRARDADAETARLEQRLKQLGDGVATL